MSYRVTIQFHSGAITTATVSRSALKAINLKAVRSVRWSRI